MKFLLDESADFPLIKILIELGHNAKSIVRDYDRSISDKEVLALAVASASSLLTIHARAAEMGFVEPTAKQTITMDSESLPVAFGRPQ